MEKLKSCPFCGNDAKLVKWESGVYTVECTGCWLELDRNYEDKDRAIRQWNTRPAPLTDEKIRTAFSKFMNNGEWDEPNRLECYHAGFELALSHAHPPQAEVKDKCDDCIYNPCNEDGSAPP